jgi:hypothetical protein
MIVFPMVAERPMMVAVGFNPRIHPTEIDASRSDD